MLCRGKKWNEKRPLLAYITLFQNHVQCTYSTLAHLTTNGYKQMKKIVLLLRPLHYIKVYAQLLL